MDAVTTKPVTLTRLRTAIAEGRSTSAKHQAEEETSPQATARLRELAAMLGDEAAAEIINTFAEDTRSLLAAMREAAARHDSAAIYGCAHSVAGAARNVGADELADRASALEEHGGAMGPEQIGRRLPRCRPSWTTCCGKSKPPRDRRNHRPGQEHLCDAAQRAGGSV